MLTQEQQAIVDIALSNPDKVIAVNSIAGSGKTATAEAVINAYRPRAGLYTAFNRAVSEEANRRFGSLINARTIHSLAYAYVRPRKIEEFSYSSIEEKVSYFVKSEVIRTLDGFYRSSSLSLDAYLDGVDIPDGVKNLVREYADRMLTGRCLPSFNFLLKRLHSMLAQGALDLRYDLFIFDEVQDVIPVTLEIFRLIHAKTKLVLGDKFQNIYSFMDTVNAFEELEDVQELRLTKSFRCVPAIAERVERYGLKYLDESFAYKGNEALEKKDGSSVYLSRYNATLICRMRDLISRSVPFRTSRPIDSIFELPKALLAARKGQPMRNRKYGFLEQEYGNFQKQDEYKDFFDFIMHVIDDPNINYTIDTIRAFARIGISISDLYREAAAKIDGGSCVTLSTAHAFKGLEADTVFLEADLDSCLNDVARNIQPGTRPGKFRKAMTREQKEMLNTYYVALSRARHAIEKVK